MLNMLYKPRTESTELQIYRLLDIRMDLSEEDKQHYYILKKGYEGEVMFDSLIKDLQCECLILNDLLLKSNNKTFQIDSLIVMSDTIYLFEVKNFEGDYYYESEQFYKKSKVEINNPLDQLNRCSSLLRQLLHSLGSNIPLDSSVVFINPEFTLYQSPLNKPIIFPTQINSYLRTLNKTTSKINGRHKQLADKLITLHNEDSPFKQIPSYSFDKLRKGIICSKCSSLSISSEGRRCVCLKCGQGEAAANAVMRSVKEFKLLFPNEKVTTTIIHEWCGAVISKKRIQMILDKHFKIVGVHRWTYYE